MIAPAGFTNDKGCLADALLDTVCPIVDALQESGRADGRTVSALFNLAARIWNGDPIPLPAVNLALVSQITKRKLELYPDDTRKIETVIVEMLDRHGSFDLHVKERDA